VAHLFAEPVSPPAACWLDGVHTPGATTMTTETIAKTSIPEQLDSRVFARLLEEGYGPGAWHGADLRQAISDVAPATAYWRPGTDRHSIAEIALHHAWCVRAVIGQLSGSESAPFPLEGSDWFEVSNGESVAWADIVRTLDMYQRRLSSLVTDIGAGTVASPVEGTERFDLVLGVTCHAIYHAGQVQLIKVLEASRYPATPNVE
jgi:hypothetical protein